MARSKLTIAIPDDLRRRAKSIAALRDENISDVIIKALEQYVEDAIDDAEDLRVALEVEARIARGEETLENWEKVKAELGALPS